MSDPSSPHRIRYPAHYHPSNTRVHVVNERVVAAPCERVWAWLVRADLWPAWYPNSSRVRLATPSPAGLALGTRFRWKTFGITLDSVVEEFVPGERIAWTAKATGVDAYHAWLLHPAADGCRVLTEETQHGWVAALSHSVMRHRMRRGHDLWLERLERQAAAGVPPPAAG
jgi:uncharacterized protein YndB with AHSA1/START domain